MDWDTLMKNVARGGDFTGRNASDEQAYFKAFAGAASGSPRIGRLQRIGHACTALIGFFSTASMLK